jgi:hypothetical protein
MGKQLLKSRLLEGEPTDIVLQDIMMTVSPASAMTKTAGA